MICVQLMGGLGNQMFQYACGRALSQKNQTHLVLDTTRLQNKKGERQITFRSYELEIFKLNAREAEKFEIQKYKTLFYRVLNVLYLQLGFSGIQFSKYFIEKKLSYNTAILNVSSDCFISGYWQSPYYFQSIEALIRNDFRFPSELDFQNSTNLNFILNSCSVSLHIRRTDFINNSPHDIHGICSLDYYNNAIENITATVSKPTFIIFSDDIEWAKENLNIRFPCLFVSGNNGDKSYIDMHLMSNCKHNIIANSSFSWWGAWLNVNKNKIVIAPKLWYTKDKLNEQTKDLIPENWIRI